MTVPSGVSEAFAGGARSEPPNLLDHALDSFQVIADW